MPVFKYNPLNNTIDFREFNNIVNYKNNLKLSLLENYSNWISISNIKDNFMATDNYDNIQYINVNNNKIIYNGVLYNFANEQTYGPINKFAIVIDIYGNDADIDNLNITFEKVDNTLTDDNINNKEKALIYVIKIPKNYLRSVSTYNIYNYVDDPNKKIITHVNDVDDLLDIDIIKKYFIYLNVYFKENLFIKFKEYFKTIVAPTDNTIKKLYDIVQINTPGTKVDNEGIFYDKGDVNTNVYKLVISKNNNLTYPIIRYFDYIIPAFNNVSKSNYELENRFHLYFKDKKNSNAFGKNNIYNEKININKYKPIKYIDIHNTLCIDKDENLKYNYEYKHFLDNVIYNLDNIIEIKYNGELFYEDLIIQETEEKSLEVFKNYMKKYINIKNDDDIYLFLYKKYKLNFLSMPKYINMSGDKMYELIYKFTLI